MKENIVGLRPSSFDQYLGQAKLKEKLNILIDAAKGRGDQLDHMLLSGPPGLGKTTIARVIASKIGSKLKITSGPVLERAGDIAAILISLQDSDILFIDEIHRLNKSVEEMLYPAMEDRELDLVIGRGPTAKSMRIKLKGFTIIGATTKASMLTSPLRDRFGFSHRLELYSYDELSQIIERSAKILNLNIDRDASMELAKISRGTPRIANKFLKRARDFVNVQSSQTITKQSVKDLLKLMDIDSYGLDNLDREILKIIVNKYSGGPVGIDTIAATLGEDKNTIESVHESYLVKIGLLDRTKRGRVATKLGYIHVKENLDEK